MVIEKAPVITVYSKTPCVQCTAVKRHLGKKEGAVYTVEDLTIDPDNPQPDDAEKQNKLDALKELGYTGVPVTFVNDDHFYGYVADKLDDAVARQRRAQLHVVEAAA
jgi:glutaredoxin